MNITIHRDGQNDGPYTNEQIQEMLKHKQILETDLAWGETSTEWVPLSQIPGIASDLPPPPIPVVSEKVATKLVLTSPSTAATAINKDVPVIIDLSKKTSTKNFYVAWLLCLFLGVFGAHRFYLGKKKAVLMLCTLGGLGIWSLIDLVRLLSGKVKDGNEFLIINRSPKLTWIVSVILLVSQLGNIVNSGGTDSYFDKRVKMAVKSELVPDPSLNLDKIKDDINHRMSNGERLYMGYDFMLFILIATKGLTWHAYINCAGEYCEMDGNFNDSSIKTLKIGNFSFNYIPTLPQDKIDETVNYRLNEPDNKNKDKESITRNVLHDFREKSDLWQFDNNAQFGCSKILRISSNDLHYDLNWYMQNIRKSSIEDIYKRYALSTSKIAEERSNENHQREEERRQEQNNFSFVGTYQGPDGLGNEGILKIRSDGKFILKAQAMKFFSKQINIAGILIGTWKKEGNNIELHERTDGEDLLQETASVDQGGINMSSGYWKRQ